MHSEFRDRLDAEQGTEPRDRTWRKLLAAEDAFVTWHAEQIEKQRKEHVEKGKREAAKAKRLRMVG